ncbi:TPA: hypothetical protein ACH3X2_013898 [Trebouxia sp. C0005]
MLMTPVCSAGSIGYHRQTTCPVCQDPSTLLHSVPLARRKRPAFTVVRAKGQSASNKSGSSSKIKTEAKEDLGLGLKAVWYGAEQFGNVVGLRNKKQRTEPQRQPTQMTRQEVLDSIRRDYGETYFFTGVGEMEAYESDCTFADPFTSFNGVERFKKNVSNLGGLLQDIKLDIYDWQEADGQLETKWRVSGIVQLPWRPLLAAAGGTTHVFSQETGRVVKHIEMWDVEPGKVLKRLLKPAARTPSSRWETLMLSLHEGDVRGVWLAASAPILKYSAPVVGVSLVTKVLTGHGLPGGFLGGIEGVSWLLLVAAFITQAQQLMKNVSL